MMVEMKAVPDVFGRREVVITVGKKRKFFESFYQSLQGTYTGKKQRTWPGKWSLKNELQDAAQKNED